MANLNSGPFSDLWQVGAHDICSKLNLVLIIADAMLQANLWKWEPKANKTVLRCLPISCPYSKALRTCLEVLCWFEVVDDPPHTF